MADLKAPLAASTPVSEDDVGHRRESNDSPDDMTPITESPSMSRSSSISIETSGKPPKPRRPINYAERKSSITKKRPTLSGQLNTLKLNQPVPSPASQNILSPPVSANTTPNATFTPILETSQPSECPTSSSSPSGSTEIGEPPAPPTPNYPLPLPTRPEQDVPRAPATQMYWHQPPVHGMMATGPMRRSHAIAQIGASFYIFGGSDGKPPKATNTMFIFDAGMIPSVVLM